MPLESLVWYRRLKAIEHEYRVANLGMRRLVVHARSDPTILESDMKFSGIGEALDNLNNTYAIRLFAEFETGLRHFWEAMRLDPEPRSIAEIIDRVASRHRIGSEQLANAHRVRKDRNRQAHDNEEEGEAIDVRDCRRFLNAFFGEMPTNWERPTASRRSRRRSWCHGRRFGLPLPRNTIAQPARRSPVRNQGAGSNVSFRSRARRTLASKTRRSAAGRWRAW